jgi:hypothetical protein
MSESVLTDPKKIGILAETKTRQAQIELPLVADAIPYAHTLDESLG